jgi:hypothetical protein
VIEVTQGHRRAGAQRQHHPPRQPDERGLALRVHGGPDQGIAYLLPRPPAMA